MTFSFSQWCLDWGWLVVYACTFAICGVLIMALIPGHPAQNYAESHQKIDPMSICGPYYESFTVGSKYVRTITDEPPNLRSGYMIMGTDMVEREVHPDMGWAMPVGARFETISQDLRCGKAGHKVLIYAVRDRMQWVAP